jgi:hypothetical protein
VSSQLPDKKQRLGRQEITTCPDEDPFPIADVHEEGGEAAAAPVPLALRVYGTNLRM